MDLSYIPQAAYAAQDRDRDKLRDTAKISVVFFFCFYFFKVFCNSIFLHVFTVPSFLHFGKLICVAQSSIYSAYDSTMNEQMKSEEDPRFSFILCCVF